MDSKKLLADILTNLASDPMASEHLGNTLDVRWQTNPDGFLLHNERTYVPDSNNLRLRVLQHKHDHILSGHFGVNKTLEMVQRDFT